MENEDSYFEGKKELEKPTTKINKSVQTVEEKVKSWQERVNEWRVTITKNEKFIIILSMFSGMIGSYAVNVCTGNFNVPFYAYGMAVALMVSCSLLLITEGGLSLIVLIKFAAAFSFGHFAMMFLIVADGAIGLFTVAACKNPVTVDIVLSGVFGICMGYIAAYLQMEKK